MYSISKNDIITFYNDNTVDSYANKNVIEGFDEENNSPNTKFIIITLIILFIFILLAAWLWWYFTNNRQSQKFGFRFY
jgi:cytoskeletal protein RodZ